MRRLALVAYLLVAAVAPASAQPRTNPPPQQPQPQDRREAVKRRIRALRAATLTDELNLDDKTLARLLPVLAKWDDVIGDLLKKRIDIQRRLASPDVAKDPRATDRLIDEAVANQKAFWDVEEKRLAELRKILTPAQTARLLVVLPEFERKIMNQLRRAILHPNGGGNRRGGGRGLDVDDDDFEDDEPIAPRGRR
ncbi:MAG TPA: hypothetical protein VFQ53_10130 [Kofleriaceae bacterium]|nr:hypothetical protein [Kofleriaceae bacterium]